jgi:hypothetical protein
MRRSRFSALAKLGLLLVALSVAIPVQAQRGGGPGGFGGGGGGGGRGGFGGGRGFGGAAQPAQAAAQVDLTGYWVALVTEDWLWRMITAPRGDATSVPLAFQAQQAAAQWDPAQDAANGEACRPFGAAGLMRMPVRLHITWEDENTLRIDTDAGEQTRLLHFGNSATPDGERSWQGFTQASWTVPSGGGFDLRAAISGQAAAPRTGPPMGSIKAVTTNMRSGYLRKNGIPYSENAVLTEYFSRVAGFGNDYLTVLTIVNDPAYLSSEFVISSQFKREPDDSKWNPTPCQTAPPLAERRR